MEKVPNAIVLSATLASFALAGLSSFALLGSLLHRSATVYQCNAADNVYTPISHIVQSGPEYILVNTDNLWSRNSFLVTKEDDDMPVNWRFRGMQTTSTNWQGFELSPRTENESPILDKVSFDTNSLKLKITYATNPYSKATEPAQSIECKPTKNQEFMQVKNAANNVPVQYLEQRSSGLGLLRPLISQLSFNKNLLKVLETKEHSEYSRYHLLSVRNESSLSPQEKKSKEELRQLLINANSSTRTVATYTCDYYWWEFANEKEEALKHARKWCEDQSYGNKDELLKQGYKVTSTQSVSSETPGWQKHLYPDGRFAGYVKYKSRCSGTQYNLTLYGDVDNLAENSYQDR